ncbi:MAG: DUF1573 domain-containing protein [Nitrospirae bacterium]|jgi:hypothetical protein|nr:DUF1573 domain-containing protein [Nitrospirota bacterium]
MKKIILIIVLLALPAICFAQPSIIFDKERQDFGEVKKGTELQYTFEFTNNGNEELVISKIITS